VEDKKSEEKIEENEGRVGEKGRLKERRRISRR
jgi:hypothetical protein